MKIVIDKNIPFIKGLLEPYAEVLYMGGGEILPQIVSDADALIVRTRTKCDSRLLSGSSVKFIATATIGTDHIDLDYCRENGITVTNAAGCNAGGVMQYLFTALYGVAQKKGIALPVVNGNGVSSEVSGDKGVKSVLGVIGVGNVGSRVADLGEMLGFEVLRCDPLKEREQTLAFNTGKIRLDQFKDYYSLDYLLRNSDIVTMHTWLDDTTMGMADRDFFSRMKDGAIFINASRGEVVNEEALLENSNRFSGLVIDVWCNEPSINVALLEKADIATPHIAGYSLEGKQNGTVYSIRSLARFYGIKELEDFSIPLPYDKSLEFTPSGLNNCEISRQLTDIFPIFEVDSELRSNPGLFENIRSNYNYRREFYVNPTTKTTDFR